MAAVKHEVVKSKLTVFVDPTNAAAFATDNLRAIAVAQSYNLDEGGDTQEVIDLADAAADWANPEVTKKNWSVSVDALVLRENPSGDIDVDDATQSKVTSLRVGDIVWVAIAESTFPDGLKYGKAVVTAFNQSGSAGEFHTASATFTGKGELLEYSAV